MLRSSRRKLFCLTVPKDFVEEPFSVVFQKNFTVAKKFFDKRGGEYQDFVLRKIFVSQCRKIS